MSDRIGLLDVLEAAQRLHVSRRQLYVLMNAGELKSVRIGRRRLFSETHLREYIESLEAA